MVLGGNVPNALSYAQGYHISLRLLMGMPPCSELDQNYVQFLPSLCRLQASLLASPPKSFSKQKTLLSRPQA
jgi:hypothetical protein